VHVEFRWPVAPGYDLGRASKSAHERVQLPGNLEDYARATRGNQWHVAAELDGIAKPLLGMEKNGLARDFV
jgi:hypothetical protein